MTPDELIDDVIALSHHLPFFSFNKTSTGRCAFIFKLVDTGSVYFYDIHAGELCKHPSMAMAYTEFLESNTIVTTRVKLPNGFPCAHTSFLEWVQRLIGPAEQPTIKENPPSAN